MKSLLVIDLINEIGKLGYRKALLHFIALERKSTPAVL